MENESSGAAGMVSVTAEMDCSEAKKPCETRQRKMHSANAEIKIEVKKRYSPFPEIFESSRLPFKISLFFIITTPLFYFAPLNA